ncbi:transmembrane protease serine 12 [Alligator mississippiensis]|nr:transmembrane protease serine 12 [Alligator mississippiensis]
MTSETAVGEQAPARASPAASRGSHLAPARHFVLRSRMRPGLIAAPLLGLLLLLQTGAGVLALWTARRAPAGTWRPRGNAALPRAGCGEQPLVDQLSGPRIVGGRDAPLGAWPWQVSLQVFRPGLGFRHLCGGALVAERVVLSAAHCARDRRDPSQWRAMIGVNNLFKPERHTVKSSVEEIVIHPEFKKETFENDIALFKLDKSLGYSDYIQPICLPFAHFHVNIENRTQCFITGWGSISEKGESARILQEAEVYIIPSDICNGFDWYAGMITANMLCAGDESGGIDSCQGDSGGPLACYDPSASKYYLTGITSFGFGCGRPRLPGIYVRMSQYDRWVNTHILLGSKSTAMSIALALNFLCVGWILLETA